jgi:hypothetical protein
MGGMGKMGEMGGPELTPVRHREEAQPTTQSGRLVRHCEEAPPTKQSGRLTH